MEFNRLINIESLLIKVISSVLNEAEVKTHVQVENKPNLR